jgi:hypothetical protein
MIARTESSFVATASTPPMFARLLAAPLTAWEKTHTPRALSLDSASGRKEREMRMIVGVAPLAAAALFTTPAANAQTTLCSGERYLLIDEGFPGVRVLRAIDLPVLTDGYAPRCLVAEAVAGLVQDGVQQKHRLPSVVHPRGARWDGGLWSVTYRFQKTRDGGYQVMTARRGRQQITAHLTS